MRSAVRPRYDAGEGADKAFWISFADLMTALMVLFLMVMAVALLNITRSTAAMASQPESAASAAASDTAVPAASVAAAGRADTPETQAITQLMAQLAQAVAATPGLQLDTRRHVIEFGDRARFPTGSHRLEADSAKLLRQFAPQLLTVTTSELGRRWVSRVVVEGFADVRGDYLFNLNLSLQRAQRVLCALLDAPDDGSALSDVQRHAVAELFAVGGFSFNDQRASLDASRRIELRIEFGERPTMAGTAAATSATGFGSCRLAA